MIFLSIWLNNSVRSLQHFYIDAGTGSLIIQIIIGSVAGGLVLLKMTWKQVKNVFKHKPIFKEKPEKDQDP